MVKLTLTLVSLFLLCSCDKPTKVPLKVPDERAPLATANKTADKAVTPHLAFVTEYVRELAAIENLRASAERDFKEDSKHTSIIPNSIHAFTAYQLELRSQSDLLNDMRLDGQFAELIPDLKALREEEIAVYQQMIDLMDASNTRVSLRRVVTEMPKLRAKIDYLDQAAFEATPLIFGSLIDQKPDSKNHLSHLIITKAERTDLLTTINNDFGTKLDQKTPNFIVSSAAVLKGYLLKNYKSSDEPWE